MVWVLHPETGEGQVTCSGSGARGVRRASLSQSATIKSRMRRLVSLGRRQAPLPKRQYIPAGLL